MCLPDLTFHGSRWSNIHWPIHGLHFHWIPLCLVADVSYTWETLYRMLQAHSPSKCCFALSLLKDRCLAPVLGPSWFPQFWLCLPSFPQPSLHLCALSSLASDLTAIFATFDFPVAQSPSIMTMPTSHTFSNVSNNVLSHPHQLPTAFMVSRVHQVHDQAAPINPSYLGWSVPMTTTQHVVEVLTPGLKPPEGSALRSAYGPCVCYVWHGPSS